MDNENLSFSEQDIEQNKVIALLGYLIFFIPLLAAKDSRYATYHANQGLILFICAVGVNFVLGVIPIIGWLLLPFANIAVFVFVVMGMLNAYNGRAKELPYIGKYRLLPIK